MDRPKDYTCMDCARRELECNCPIPDFPFPEFPVSESIKLIYYVPIFEWGENSDSVYGNASGTELFTDLKDLYGFNPDAVGSWLLRT